LKKIADIVERYLIRFIVLGIVVLVIVQGIMTKDSMRLYLSWDERLEGQSIELPVSSPTKDIDKGSLSKEINSPYALITISINQFSSLPESIVLVNGEEKERFTSNKITLELMAGDIVEIDSRYYNSSIEYKIEDTSENIAYPEEGNTFTANKGIVMIGKIIVK
jgi:hypothetical protein